MKQESPTSKQSCVGGESVQYDDYLVYQIPLIDEQYEQLVKRIDDMNENIRMYNYISAMLIPANIPVVSEGSFICSAFVADLIDKYTDIELKKDTYLHRPMDILEVMNDYAEKSIVSRINVLLPEKEETPLDFQEVFKDWEASVKNVTERNLDNMNSAINDYERWLRNVLDRAEALESLKTIRSEHITGEAERDYRAEYEEYLDERYGEE